MERLIPKVEDKNGLKILSIEGKHVDLALDTVPDVSETFMGAAEDDSTTSIVVDLSNVNFMDSNALALVVGIYKSVEERQSPMVVDLYDPTAPERAEELKRKFMFGDLDSLFPLIVSRDDY